MHSTSFIKKRTFIHDHSNSVSESCWDKAFMLRLLYVTEIAVCIWNFTAVYDRYYSVSAGFWERANIS